jgi:hypothetical protein
MIGWRSEREKIMTMPNSEWEALALRVAQLERQSRRGKYLLVLCVGLGVAWFGTSQWPRGPEAQAAPPGARSSTVTAEQFVLVDDQGRPRARLAGGANGPALRLLDQAGHTRGAIGLDHDRPFSRFYDDKGHPRIDLSQRAEGSFLMLHDEAGRVRVALGLRKEGAFLRIDDEDGRSRIGLLLGRDSNLSVSDSAGRPLFSRRF